MLPIKNYRSPSVLPVFLQNPREITNNHLLSFINSPNILANNQYGFREIHSTFMAFLNLIDQVISELNNKNRFYGHLHRPN